MASEIKVDTISENTSNNGVAFTAPLKLKQYTQSQIDALSGMSDGEMVYNTTTKRNNIFDGTVWREGSSVAGFDLDYLVVAGGGGGGKTDAGGGGAGGLISGTYSLINRTGVSLTIAVGAAGAGETNTQWTRGASGSNSSISGDFSFTAIGGGGGGSGSAATGDSIYGADGGSGGGAGSTRGNNYGAGTANQGTDGGAGTTSGNGAGGGGGASQSGRSASQNGAGGTGTASSITGTSLYYADGGGAGHIANQTPQGGSGTGGSGSVNGAGAGSSASPANRGSGGGGGGGSHGNGGNGSSGVVILRYLTSDLSNFTVTSTGGTTATDGNYTVITYTGAGVFQTS